MSAPVVPAVYEDALFHVHAMECALRAQFLTLVADYGQTETWRLDGARGMEEWVAGRFAMSPYQAREMVRVAEALKSLPKITEVFSQGHLSWDQLRALTRYATAAESRAEAQDDSLLMWRQGERLGLKANLGGDLAAVVEKALTRALEGFGIGSETARRLCCDARRAGPKGLRVCVLRWRGPRRGTHTRSAGSRSLARQGGVRAPAAAARRASRTQVGAPTGRLPTTASCTRASG